MMLIDDLRLLTVSPAIDLLVLVVLLLEVLMWDSLGWPSFLSLLNTRSFLTLRDLRGLGRPFSFLDLLSLLGGLSRLH